MNQHESTMEDSGSDSSSIDSPAADSNSNAQANANDIKQHQQDSTSAVAAAGAEAESNSSAASSTSTQWPSPPEESPSQSQDVTQLQDILDRALHDPFSTHPEVTAHLKSNIDSHCRLAAEKIHGADVLLVVTGAGFSADSGLATYVDVADIDAYRNRGWRYRDLCKPPAFTDFSALKINNDDGEEISGAFAAVEKGGDNGAPNDVDISPVEAKQKDVMDNDDIMEVDDEIECNNDSESASNNEGEGNGDHHRKLYYQEHLQHITGKSQSMLPDEDDIEHPQHFYGFWGQCCNDYRRVRPHDGYEIIKRWGQDKNYLPTKDDDDELIAKEENIEGNASIVAQEIRNITHILERGDNDSDSSDGSECFNFKEDDESEPYYVSPKKRAGAFFLFTSNVDAHSFDVFKSHEIRECHGNVELWQCHNFACGTNATVTGGGSLDGSPDGLHAAAAGGSIVEDEKQQSGVSRRLWRLPMDFQFSVDCDTMCAPHSKTPHATKTTQRTSFGSSGSSRPPASKRRKSSMQGDDDNGSTASSVCDQEKKMGSTADGANARSGVCAEKYSHDNSDTAAVDCAENGDTPDIAAALGGIMEDTLRNHLKKEVEDSPGKSQGSSGAAHVGDVHGKPRLFPLQHMNPPSSIETTKESYYLPITATDNWPRCPRCKEAARPAVLMFEDLDWVYSLKQERRWQTWCQSLLKLCKQKSRGNECLDSDSESTASDTNMSESGWEDVPAASTERDVNHAAEVPTPAVAATDGQTVVTLQPPPPCEPSNIHAPSTERDVNQAAEISAPAVAAPDGQQTTATSLQPPPSEPSNIQPLSPLKVTILEIGCGYNVPTCRVIAERLVGELSKRGGDASLIRINPSHPEPDDDDVEDNIISIMEKGLDALKIIDEHYCELVRGS